MVRLAAGLLQRRVRGALLAWAVSPPPVRPDHLQYAEQVRQRLEKQLHRRARELGYELKKVEPGLETVGMPEGEILTVTPEGVIVET